MSHSAPDRQRQRVALTRVDGDPTAALARAFDLLESAGERRLADLCGLVTIKPNVTAVRPSGSGIVTDVAVVRALVTLLRRRAPGIARIVVGDGPGMADALAAFSAAGYDELRALGVELVDFNRAPTRATPVPGWLRYPTLEIPSLVLDADLFVSLTPLKTHTDGLLTLHAKNLFGVPPTRFYGRPRRAFHRAGVSEVVHDICRARPIDLAITDATVCLQLGSPIDGEPVPLGALAVGWNAQAVDILGCAMMGVDPATAAYLNYLRAAGAGPITLDGVEVLGDPLRDVARRFATPETATLARSPQRDSAH